MSELIYLASDLPFSVHENPHEHYMSVNQALAEGIEVDKELLKKGVDRDDPDMVCVSDREVYFDLDTDELYDGDFDDDYAVLAPDEAIDDLYTTKKHTAILELLRFTKGRSESIAAMLKDHLRASGGELEVWHIYEGIDGGDERPRIRKRFVNADSFSGSELMQIDSEDVTSEPFTQYCLVIKL